MYMNEIMTSLKTDDEGVNACFQLIELLGKAGFKIWWWCSNRSNMPKDIPLKDRSNKKSNPRQWCHILRDKLCWWCNTIATCERTDNGSLLVQWTYILVWKQRCLASEETLQTGRTFWRLSYWDSKTEDDLSDRFFIAVDGFIEVLKLSTKLDKTDKGDSMGEAIC